MRSSLISSLLFAAFTSVSVAVSAAPGIEPVTPPTTITPPIQTEQSLTLKLNAADAETLQRELSGVGIAKAQAIVAYREANGDFASIDELLEVKGIGKAILDRNREKLSLD